MFVFTLTSIYTYKRQELCRKNGIELNLAILHFDLALRVTLAPAYFVAPGARQFSVSSESNWPCMRGRREEAP